MHALKGLGRIGEKVATDKAGRGPSPDPDHAGTLISDLQPPDCEEPLDFKQNKFLLSHLVCGVLLWQAELTNTVGTRPK